MNLRTLMLSARAAVLVLAPVIVACSDDDETSPTSQLVGTWEATSFQGLGQEFIALGMDLTLTLTSSGTYTIAFQNDLIGACDPGPNCNQTGNYTATASQITIDAGTADATTFDYTIAGTTLTFTGSIDGNPVTIIFHRVS